MREKVSYKNRDTWTNGRKRKQRYKDEQSKINSKIYNNYVSQEQEPTFRNVYSLKE